MGPTHSDTLGGVNNLANLLSSKGDYTGAEPLYRRALEGLLKLSAATGRPHADLENFISNYADCLEGLGHSGEEIRQTLEAMLRPFGTNLCGGREHVEMEQSPELGAVIERLMQDPSRLQELAEQLQREDLKLFMELVQWIQSQQ